MSAGPGEWAGARTAGAAPATAPAEMPSPTALYFCLPLVIFSRFFGLPARCLEGSGAGPGEQGGAAAASAPPPPVPGEAPPSPRGPGRRER